MQKQELYLQDVRKQEQSWSFNDEHQRHYKIDDGACNTVRETAAPAPVQHERSRESRLRSLAWS
eukprot:SAG31_NODE_631_length_13367_cov_6.190648_10_plen_64_part_00